MPRVAILLAAMAAALILLIPAGIYAKISDDDAAQIASRSQQLQDSTKPESERTAAATALITMSVSYTDLADKADAIKPLLDILGGTDELLAVPVLAALGDNASQFALNGGKSERLLAALVVVKLGSLDEAVRAAAIATVSKHKNSAMEQRLIVLLRNDKMTAEARASAAQALGTIGAQPAISVLIGAAKDNDLRLQEACLTALKTITTNETVAATPEAWEAWWTDHNGQSMAAIHRSAQIEKQAAFLHNSAQAEDSRIKVAVSLLTMASNEPDDARRAEVLQPLESILTTKEETLSIAVLNALITPNLIVLNGHDQYKVIAALVVGKLGSANEAVRAAAIDTIDHHHNGSMEQRLIQVLMAPAAGITARESAAKILGRFRSRRAVEPLIKTFDSKEPVALRMVAAQTLGEIAHLSSVATLIQGLKPGNPDLVAVCGDALRRITWNRTRGNTPAEWEQWWAANNTKQRDEIRYEEFSKMAERLGIEIKKLRTVIADDRIQQVRQPNVKLEMLHTVLSNNHIRDLLRDESGRVILAALEVLKERPEQDRVASRQYLNNLIAFPSDGTVRLLSAQLLANKLADPSSVSALAAQLPKESNPETKEALSEALRLAITPEHAPATLPLLIALTGDGDGHVRENAIRSLGKLNRPEALAPALKLLVVGPDGPVEPVERVRYFALEVVGMLKNAEAVPVIVALIGAEEKPNVRQQAVLALGQIGGGTAEEALLAVLASKEEDSKVRAKAAEVLESLGVGDFVTRLTSALTTLDLAKDPQFMLRKAAIQALGRRGPLSICETLATEIRNHGEADPAVKEAGWNAILAICQRAAASKEQAQVVALTDSLTAQFQAAVFGAQTEAFATVIKACKETLKKVEETDNRIAEQVANLGSDNPETVTAAQAELKAFGLRAVSQLIGALGTGTDPAKAVAHSLLKEITGQEFPLDPAPWQAWHTAHQP